MCNKIDKSPPSSPSKEKDFQPKEPDGPSSLLFLTQSLRDHDVVTKSDSNEDGHNYFYNTSSCTDTSIISSQYSSVGHDSEQHFIT